MSNLLWQVFGLDEEYDNKLMESINQSRKEGIKNKECWACKYFYDYSTGVNTDYGCKLPCHDKYAISHEKDCPDWVRRGEQDE